MSLTWLKRDPHYCETECGRYSISRSLAEANQWLYLAWRRGGDAPIQLGDCVSDFKTAAARCEADAIKTTEISR